MTRSPQSDAAANGPNANDELYLLACRLERERKTSAADWLNQVEQANARVSRALQQVALAERERDKAAEDATNYHARIGELEQERDEARADCERLNRLLRAETALGQGDIDHWAELQRERDEAREALSEIAFYLSVGMGDETTTSQQYSQRIKEGIKMLTDPIVNLWKREVCEVEEANARIAVLEEEQKILAKGFPSPAKAAVIEGVEKQNLPAGVSRIGCHERPEPSPHLSETPETDALVNRHAEECTDWMLTADSLAKHARRLERERDEAQADCERLNQLLRHETTLGQGDIDHWAALEAERDEAIAARKSSAADWLNQIEQANARVSRALQQEARAAAISRRYICHECGRKGRHSKQNRGAQPICPPCDFSRLFGSGRPEDWEGFDEAVEGWRESPVAGGREMSGHDAIEQAWRDYHGPIKAEGEEDYFPALPPLFKRGFLYGVEYAKRERDEAREDVRKLQDIKRKHEHEELVADTGDDSLHNVRRLRAQIRELEHENARLREVLGKMIKLASTGDWDGEDPLIEAEHILSNVSDQP